MLNKRILAIGFLFILVSISFVPSATKAGTFIPSTISTIKENGSFNLAIIDVNAHPYNSTQILIKHDFTCGWAPDPDGGHMWGAPIQITPIIPSGEPILVIGTLRARFFIGVVVNVTGSDGSWSYRIKGFAIGFDYTDYPM